MKRKNRLVRLDLTAAVGHPSEKSVSHTMVWFGISVACVAAGWLIWTNFFAG